MKTAMQELVEVFEEELKIGELTLTNDEGYIIKWAIFHAKQRLEKEKEQIIDAHTNGHNDCYEYNFLKNSANEISFRNGEDYYNETYKAK